MARVKFFNAETIRAYQKTVDFYYWKGIPVARKWPDWSNFKPSPAQKLSMEAMRESRRRIAEITPDLREMYRQVQTGKKANWLDVVTARFMVGWGKTRLYPPVLTSARVVDAGANYEVISTWTGGTNVWLGIELDTVSNVTKYREKKGIEAPYKDEPSGDVMLEESDPVPIPYHQKPQPYTSGETWISCQSGNAYFFKLPYGQDADPAVAIGQVWDRFASANSWMGGFTNIGRISTYGGITGDGQYWVQGQQRGVQGRIKMTNWYRAHPGVDPQYIKIYFQASVFDGLAGSVDIENVGVLGMVPFGQGVGFECPAEWKINGRFYKKFFGSGDDNFGSTFDGKTHGFEFTWNTPAPPYIYGYLVDPGKIKHVIPKADLPQVRRKRYWYIWDYNDLYFPVGSLALPLEV